jgi:hypothetical protein
MSVRGFFGISNTLSFSGTRSRGAAVHIDADHAPLFVRSLAFRSCYFHSHHAHTFAGPYPVIRPLCNTSTNDHRSFGNWLRLLIEADQAYTLTWRNTALRFLTRVAYTMEFHIVSRQGDAQGSTQPKTWPNHAEALTAISIAFMTITIFCTSLRFFVRGYMIKSLGWDDWLILVSLVSFVCQASFLIHLAWIIQHEDLNMIKTLADALEVSKHCALGLTLLTIVSYSLSFWNLHSTS